MQKPSLSTPLTRPIGQSAAAAVIAGAAMGAITGARAACHLRGVLPGPYGCAPGGAPTGALVGALVALGALPLLGQGTRPGEHAAHLQAATTTTTAARLVWLAIAAALGRWLAEGLLHPQMGLEGLGWMAILPVVLVAAAGLAMAARGCCADVAGPGGRPSWPSRCLGSPRWPGWWTGRGVEGLPGRRAMADPRREGRGRPGHTGAVPGHQHRRHRAAHDPSHQAGFPIQPPAPGLGCVTIRPRQLPTDPD